MDPRIKEVEILHNKWAENKVIHQQTNFLGVKAQRNPLDAWIFQEIIYEKRPDLIIETGSHQGGTTLFLATICDAVNNGRIISIDNDNLDKVSHNRITYLTGSSVEASIFKQIQKTIKDNESVMVILDSDHHKDHVGKEIELYHQLITKGQYLIVDDTFWGTEGMGPYPAVQEFLIKHPEFIIDKSKEKYLFTFIPNGFLLRK